MSDEMPNEIWLEPKCCADRYFGQLWSTKDVWTCEEGNHSTKYILAARAYLRLQEAAAQPAVQEADMEAIGWAVSKLTAFGVGASSEDSAFMMDRLILMTHYDTAVIPEHPKEPPDAEKMPKAIKTITDNLYKQSCDFEKSMRKFIDALKKKYEDNEDYKEAIDLAEKLRLAQLAYINIPFVNFTRVEEISVLRKISNMHLGDCPAAMDELDHAKNHIMKLRRLATAILKPEGAEKIAAGDYVLATKWNDGDPFDHWCVGYYDKPYYDRHLVIDEKGEQLRGNGFRRVSKISLEYGMFLVEHAENISPKYRPGIIGSLWDTETSIRSALAILKPEGA